MFVYVNRRTGRELRRPTTSRHLDESSGWERLDWKAAEAADVDDVIDPEADAREDGGPNGRS